MPRRDGPTTLRTVNGYACGALKVPSARSMQAEINDRHAALEIRALVDANPALESKIRILISEGKRGPEILEALRP